MFGQDSKIANLGSIEAISVMIKGEPKMPDVGQLGSYMAKFGSKIAKLEVKTAKLAYGLGDWDPSQLNCCPKWPS